MGAQNYLRDNKGTMLSHLSLGYTLKRPSWLSVQGDIMNRDELEKRRNALLKLSKIMRNKQSEWVKRSVDETFVTTKYAKVDNFQAQRGMAFKSYELDFLEGRLPLGKIRLQFPKNAVGVAMGVSFAAAYMAGNSIDIRLSSTQEGLADLIADIISEAELQEISVIKADSKVFMKDSILGGYNGLHVFGHDRNIIPWSKEIGQTIEQGYLDIFAAELTGKDFYFVLEDANVKKAAKDFLAAATISSGQVCMSPEAAFVHESRRNEFIKYLIEYSHYLTVGDPYNRKTDIGPLLSEGVYKNAVHHLEDAIRRGAEEHSAGKFRFTKNYEHWEKNLLIPDKVLVVNDWESTALHEETFCPGLIVVPFKYYDQVINHMRSLDYGLTSSIYGKNMLNVVKERMNGLIGIIFENQPFFRGFDVHKRCWGGFKKSGWVQYKDKNGEVKRVHGPKHLISLFSRPD